MKEVGIITIHKSTNYGACLQAHALWKFIEQQGYKCHIIDLYRNIHQGFIPSKKYVVFEKPYIDTGQMSDWEFIKRPLRKIYKDFFDYIYSDARKRRKERFDKFNSMSTYSHPYQCIDNIYKFPPKYDLYITGSDQVWNPTIGIPLEPFFLTFTNSPNKISYASSFGVSSIEDKYKRTFASWLSSYRSISVRENDGAQIVKEITGRDATVCLDPTLLIGADYWKSIAASPDIANPYILLFFIKGISAQVLSYCASIAHSRNCELVIIGEVPFAYYLRYHVIADAGPLEFIGLIENAQIVFTDSFHGFAFSVMLNDNFYILLDKAVKGKSRNSRINTLLDAFELHDRVIDVENSNICVVNRQKLNMLISKRQSESKSYLLRNLEQ